jgi:lauroyl/myristoyl acyltransferase
VLRIIRFLLHIAGSCLGVAWRLIPRARRFDAAKAAASAVAPLLRMWRRWQVQNAHMMETPPEAALQMVLRALDRAGTEYDPILQVHGAESFAAAREAGRGLLMVGPHAMLSKLVVRYLHDHGYAPILVSAAPMRLGGLRRPPAQIVKSDAFLLHVRTALRAGSILFSMVDHDDESSHRITAVPTIAGPVFLSNGLIRVAQRCGAAILFFSSTLSDDGVVHIDLEPPSPSSVSVEAITSDLAAFVQAHVHRIQRGIRDDVRDDERVFTSEHLALKPNEPMPRRRR